MRNELGQLFSLHIESNVSNERNFYFREMLDVQSSSGRLCIKCGAPASQVVSQSAIVLCNGCYTYAIRVKFQSALNKSKLFRSGPNQLTVRVLVIFEWDARAKCLLQLLDNVINIAMGKRHFNIDPLVRFDMLWLLITF